jgi:hypothetical protein
LKEFGFRVGTGQWARERWVIVDKFDRRLRRLAQLADPGAGSARERYCKFWNRRDGG